MHLENCIYQGFQPRAVPMTSNPFQGLKLLHPTHRPVRAEQVPMTSNPFQGLKLRGDENRNPNERSPNDL